MKSLFIFLGLLYSAMVGAQSNEMESKVPGRISFFAEVGGPGILFSANLDSRFKKTNLGWGGRAGLGFVTGSTSEFDPVLGYSTWKDYSVVTVPVQVNYIFGKSNSPHTFEVGGGITFVGRKIDIMNFYDDRISNLFGTAAFMYRRQPLNGGFTWRLGFTPLIAKGYIQPSGGASVGYNF